MPEKIMQEMENIKYGVPGKNNKNLLEYIDNDLVFDKYYYLQSPEELKSSKLGVCWDQVELERDLFTKANIETESYFILTFDEEDLPSHTFLTYKQNEKVYWFEHSWGIHKGIHEYSNIKELLIDVKHKFLNSYQKDKNNPCLIYKYNKPKHHISCSDFYNFIETEELIKLNSPLYFYHLIDKNSDISKGLLSLQYMYDNKLYELFDKNAEKYKTRIISSWNIPKYKNRKEETLTREEILDALKIFRGIHGGSYIYFFKYPPKNTLGQNMANILKTKDIYRININDEEIIKNIKDIFYGYSFNDRVELNKTYYENIKEEEYFKNYNDNNAAVFSTINHIGIAFKNDYCPADYIEKIDNN